MYDITEAIQNQLIMITLYVTIMEFIKYQLPVTMIQSLFGQLIYSHHYLIYYAPNYMYNLVYLLFYPLMCCITIIAENWISLPYVAEGLSPQYEPNGAHVNSATKQQLEHTKQLLLSHSTSKLNNNIILQLYDSLPRINSIDSLGYYEGHFVRSHSILGSMSPMLQLLRSVGVRWGV